MGVLYDIEPGIADQPMTYDGYINGLKEPSLGRSWTFQTCFEFGYYQTSQFENSIFP